MWSRIRALFRVTAVRLSIIYTLIFGVAAVGIVAYMTSATVEILRQEYEHSIDNEIAGLSKIYNQTGINFLIRTLERRARAPGANLYIVTSPQGQIIAGNVPRLQPGVMSRIGWTGRPFRYSRYGDTEDDDHRAIARVLEVPNGMRILVGRDIGEYEGFGKVVGQGFKLALGSMVLLGLLTWFFVGRRALKRIDQVSKSSMRIMAGDRSERLPVTGVNDEFDRLSENLNLMLDRIMHLDDGLKQMSDNIAHDLKTPITRLRNKADEALSLQKSPTEQQETIGEIIADCDRIVKTFDALLMISRVESGASVVRFEDLDIKSTVDDVYELYEAVAEESGVALTLGEMQPNLPKIQGNRELLSQAIANLIDNAMKYGRPEMGKAEISLNIRQDRHNLSLSVGDNGSGIADEDMDRVTGRFVRLDESRNQAGNGLGLSLVKAIAELHGGQVMLEDNNPGLKATLILPVIGKSG